MRYYCEDKETVLRELNSAESGLTAAEAQTVIPTREAFESVWRYLRHQAKEEPFEITPAHLVKNIAKVFHTRETYARTMVCVHVFDERGLIQVEQQSAGVLRIGLRPVSGKVDLEQSEILLRLRRSTRS